MVSYAITDPSTLNFKSLVGDLKRFSLKADIIVYRDKSNLNYKINAKLFIEESQKLPFKKILLHTDIVLAYKLNADGIHLSSLDLQKIPLAKKLNLFVIVSTHTIEEAQKAESLGADMVTFSPIFNTPNKGKPIGLYAIKELSKVINIPIIALGGIITKEQIKECQEYGAFGFASIRYFK
jgi:thiamine-phosphate pyrophosphorylase